jgi:hypothetical protein
MYCDGLRLNIMSILYISYLYSRTIVFRGPALEYNAWFVTTSRASITTGFCC